MDKLVAHRFWICGGVALPLILFSWWWGTSGLAKEADAKIAEIEGAKGNIPKGDNHPNIKWVNRLDLVNQKRAGHYEKHSVRLRKLQQSIMDWPDAVAPAMRYKENGEWKRVKFGQPGTDENARSTYRTVYYFDTMREVYEIVDPVHVDTTDPARSVGVNLETGEITGKVVFDYANLPKVPPTEWQSRPPTWQEMWEAQLDAWLLKALLDAVNRVNEKTGTKNLSDARIREIVEVTLRGGSRSTVDETVTGATGESDDDEGETTTGIGRPIVERDQPGDLQGGLSGPQALSFNFLDVEFGPQQPRLSASTDGTEPPPDSNEDGDEGYAGASDGQPVSPWVDNDPKMPFRTRGFAIKLLMKRKDVPLLVQELTDANASRFPMEIVRIHEVDRETDFTGIEVRRQYAQALQAAGGNGGELLPGNLLQPGVDASERNPAEGAAQPLFQSALEDPGLGYVVIAGLMTIYREPPEKQEDDGQAAGTDTGKKTASPKSKKTNTPSTKQPQTKMPDGKKEAGQLKPPNPKSSTPMKTSSPGKTKKPAANGGASQGTTKAPKTTKAKPNSG